LKRALGVLLGGYVAVLAGCSQQLASESAPVQKLTANGQSSTNSNATPEMSGSVVTPGGTSSDDRVVARINGQAITMHDFMQPLIESHGLQILMGLMQLDLARQEARDEHVTVTADDIANEQNATLKKMFGDADLKEEEQLEDADHKGDAEKAKKLRQQIHDDREVLLTQYLDNQHFSRTEFALKVEINAYLRKAADRLLAGKITDDLVEKEFGVEYGETAKVQYIQLPNMLEVAKARQRLKNGEDFGDVAEQMSQNARTAAEKGFMPTFSRQSPGLPETFKTAAFTLNPGQVSDTLSLGGSFFIIRLDQKFAPKAVKFENVRESLRKSMYDRVSQASMEQLGALLAEQVVKKLQIQDPILQKQYEKYQAKQTATIHEHQQLDEQWKKEREARALTQPAATQPVATEPAAAPASAPATQP
jgi:foldase protein PrsA